MECVGTDGINNEDGNLQTEVEEEEVKFKTDALTESSAELIFKEGVKTELLPKINELDFKDGLELLLELKAEPILTKPSAPGCCVGVIDVSCIIFY